MMMMMMTTRHVFVR